MDKLITEFENKVFATKKMGRAFMDRYLKKVWTILSNIHDNNVVKGSEFEICFAFLVSFLRVIKNLHPSEAKVTSMDSFLLSNCQIYSFIVDMA